MSAGSHRKALVKLLHANAHRHHLWDVFGDFIEMAALAVRNAWDPIGHADREERYLRIAKRYEKDELTRFAQATAELVEAMEVEPGDVLGAAFGELELGNSARGQYFTPYELCRLMARLQIDDTMRAEIACKGFITVQEPAVGAGAMIIALATEMRAAGINYQQHMHVTAIDVDARAVHMAYLQFSLLHIPAVLVIGNTLTLEVRETWPTFAHATGFWAQRLARGYALGSPADQQDEQPQPAQPVRDGAQLSLFGVAA